MTLYEPVPSQTLRWNYAHIPEISHKSLKPSKNHLEFLHHLRVTVMLAHCFFRSMSFNPSLVAFLVRRDIQNHPRPVIPICPQWSISTFENNHINNNVVSKSCSSVKLHFLSSVMEEWVVCSGLSQKPFCIL